MNKKQFVLIPMLLLGMLHPASAQEVTVVGVGQDKDSALRDASRNAVEQVVGTFIDSRTLMENLVIQLDEVYKKSQGFVHKITVLDEGKDNASTYRVRARIDVDTSPNAALMDEMTMLMRLNDPRIAVIVLDSTGNSMGTASHNEDVESMLNQKLLGLGFNHVIDADHVIKIHNAQLLNSIYEGKTGLSHARQDNACEFLVLGKASSNLGNVSVPDYRTGQMRESPLANAAMKINLKVLKYDTGDLIGTFTTKGGGMGKDRFDAADNALEQAAEKAARQLEQTFKHFGAKITQGLAVTVIAQDYAMVEQLVQDLRSLGDVDNVYLRSHNGGQAVLELDTAQKPHAIVASLRARTKLNVIVESMSSGSMTLRVR